MTPAREWLRRVRELEAINAQQARELARLRRRYEGCECDRLGRSENEECIYDAPCKVESDAN